MTSIKITPFVLFLILLIVLVISAILGSYYNEGFISYEYIKQPIDLVAIPQYSTNQLANNITTYKLLDNLYFDNKNGNIIEVDGIPMDMKNPDKYDQTGVSVTGVYVTTRDRPETTVTYKTISSGSTIIPTDTPESLIDSTSDSYKTFRYDSQSLNTSSYSVFYVGWSTSTFINIIANKTKNSEAQLLCSYLFNPTVTINSPIGFKSFGSTNNALDITSFVEDTDIYNNKLVLNNSYDSTHPLFQLSKYLYYDSKNGNVIVDSTSLTVEGLGTITAARETQKNGPTDGQPNKSSVLTSGNVKQAVAELDPITGYPMVGTVSGSPSSTYKPVLSIYDRTSIDVTDRVDNNDPLFNSLQNVPFTSWFVIDKNGQNFVIYNATGKNTVVILIKYSDCCKQQMFDIVNVKRFLNGVLDEPGSNSPAPAPAPAPRSGSGSGSGSKKAPAAPPAPPDETATAISTDYILKTQIIPPVCPTCYSEEINRGSASKASGSAPKASGSAPAPVPAPAPAPAPISKTDQSTIEKPLANLAGDLVKTANDLTKGVGYGAGNLLSSFWSNNIGGGIITVNDLNYLPTGDNRQEEGDYSGANNGLPFVPGTDPYSYYGALPPKGNSNYMPVTADFSSFGN